MARTGIYKITNKITNDFYIGSAINYENRISTHFSCLRNNKHPNIHLQRSYNKYGHDVFLHELLIECEKKSLIINEQHFIDTLKPKYNICKIAGNSLGIKRSDEFKKKLSKAKNRLGKKASDKTKINISIAQKKRFRENPEALKLLQTAPIGNTHRRGAKHKESSIMLLSGENNVNSKVTTQQVIEIREKYIPRVYSSYKLAKEYNISRQQVNRIVNRVDRRHE